MDTNYKKIMIRFIKSFFIYILGGILITFMMSAFMGQAIDIKRISDISDGYVTNKKIVTHSATIFRGSVTEYQLYITGEYTKSITDVTAEYEKNFTVSEEIYNSYNIGDYFNSQNIIEKENEEKEQ